MIVVEARCLSGEEEVGWVWVWVEGVERDAWWVLMRVEKLC